MADSDSGGLRPMRPIVRHPLIEQRLPIGNATDWRDNARLPPPCQSLAHYQQEAMDRIGGENQDVRQRNKKISGVYADLWLQNHDAFRWQGLAAHASTGVGEVMDMPDPVGNVKPMMAQGNLAIYKGIVPTSLAYAHGGMAELNCMSGNLTGEQKRLFDKTRAAYADIDAGLVRKAEGSQANGEFLIREGTNKLVHFEQDDVAQPLIYDPHPFLSRAMAPFAFLQLSGDPAHPDPTTESDYYPGHLPYSLGNEAQRDDWIIHDVVPIWYQQSEQRPELTVQRMQAILERGRAAGGDY